MTFDPYFWNLKKAELRQKGVKRKKCCGWFRCDCQYTLFEFKR